MKVVQSLVVAAVIAFPVLSFAQSNQPLTRADVRAQLVELQQAGYNPASDQTQYPQNIQAAQARVNAAAGLTGYGAAADGHAVTGARSADVDVVGLGPVFAKP